MTSGAQHDISTDDGKRLASQSVLENLEACTLDLYGSKMGRVEVSCVRVKAVVSGSKQKGMEMGDNVH